MEKEICNVICIEKEQDRKAVIELTENQDSVTIKFSLGKLVLKKEGCLLYTSPSPRDS